MPPSPSQRSSNSIDDFDSDFLLSPSSSPDLIPSPSLQDMPTFTLPSPRTTAVSSPVDTSSLKSGLEHSEPDVKTPEKHERFYFEDRSVSFVVDDGILYRLHRSFFEGSKLLAGTSANSTLPIELKGVKSTEFDAFLSIIYPSNYKTCELSTVEEWKAVLRLASEWGFESIRELAIDRLEPIASAVDKIIVARSYDLTEWLVPAYAELCHRPSPLSLEEHLRLDTKDAAFICIMRERTRDSTVLFSQEEIMDRLHEHLHPTPPPPPSPPSPPPLPPVQSAPAPLGVSTNNASSNDGGTLDSGFLFSSDEIARRRRRRGRARARSESESPSSSRPASPAPPPRDNKPVPSAAPGSSVFGGVVPTATVFAGAVPTASAFGAMAPKQPLAGPVRKTQKA